MKALVTGGAGFIGSHLVDHLVDKGIEVTVVDDLSMGSIDNIDSKDQVTIHVEDVRNEEFMNQLLLEQKFDYIYFLAAVASVYDSIEHPAETHTVNQTAVLNMLEFIRTSNLKIKKFLFTSSAAVYGNLPELPKREDSRVDPISIYAIDKYATERFALAYGNLYAIPTVCVRLFNVYGPRQNPSSLYSGVLSILTDCLVEDKTFTLFGDGSQTRDFIFIDDVIQALELVTMKSEQHEVFNVANGNEVSLTDIIETYENITNKKLEIKREASRLGDVHQSVADNSKLKGLGYSTDWTLEEGLSRYWGEITSGTDKK